jgi:hypothetical protein
LTRSWFVEPNEAEARAEKAVNRHSSSWNGQDYYVSIGDGEHRAWDDCVRYGFVGGGQGRWYSRSLQNLFVGARVFACVPQRGYVGVGTVIESVLPVSEFNVNIDGATIPILSAPLRASNMADNVDDPEKSEYLVRVRWIQALTIDQAVWEKGMFANQATTCRLRHRFTLDRLTQRFGLEK